LLVAVYFQTWETSEGMYGTTCRYPLVQIFPVNTQSVLVSGKAFKAKTKPAVVVTVSLKSSKPMGVVKKKVKGRVKGRVDLLVGGSVVKRVKVSKAKTRITLPKRYSKSVKIKARYVPSGLENGTYAISKPTTLKVKR